MNARDVADLWLININLGDSCNMNCRYCFQKGILEKGVICSDDYFVSPKLISMLRRIPIFRTKMEKFKVRFTGGEPLLYFNKLKYIVEELKEVKEFFSFEIVFNGTLLTQEIVDFLNEYKFTVGVSNDGYNTVNTRGINVLDDDKLVDLICQIDNLHFVCVLSALNSNYSEIFKYFKDKIGWNRNNVYVAVNPVYDTGMLTDPQLTSFDWEEFERTTKEFFDGITYEQYNNPFSPEHYLLKRYISRFITVYSFHDKNINILDNIACGADYNHISVDTSGKVLTCHNCSNVLGDLNSLSLEEVFASFDKDKMLTNSKECVNCNARIVCNGSCPFVPYESRARYYCRLQKTIMENIERTLVRLCSEG